MKTKAEVDDFFLKVVNNQGEIVKLPQIVSWGGYSGYFKDLDGYYWEVAYGKHRECAAYSLKDNEYTKRKNVELYYSFSSCCL